MGDAAVLLHHGRPEAAELGSAAATWLEANGHAVRLPFHDAGLIGRPELGVDDRELAAGLELALSIGGDGTMLRTVDLVADGGAPVLGVNVGQLGYLTEIEPPELEKSLARFFDGAHRIEERMLLEVSVEGGRRTIALNEVVVEKSPMGHTVRLAVWIDGEFFTTYAADGLIVATPTGSTAYSLSARGPIMDPLLRAMVLTPVSPHMLFDRSLVLLPEARVRLVVEGHRLATVNADGRNLGELGEGEAVCCTAAAAPARLVRFGAGDFHRVLKQKFGLNDR